MFKGTIAVWGTVWFTLAALPGIRGASLKPLSDVTLQIDVGGKPVGHWSAGRLLQVDRDGTDSPSILVVSRDGALESSNTLTIPGAAGVFVQGYSRGDNGTIVASGVAVDNEGRRGLYLAIVPNSGSGATQVIRTGQYEAYKVAVAADGSIWTAGMERLDRSPEGSANWKAAFTPYLSSGVVRHFSSQGQQLASFVPQSTIQNFAALADSKNSLVVASGHVAWNCPREQRYVEIAADGTVLDLQGVQPLDTSIATAGFALTDADLAFLATRDGSGTNWICQLDKSGKKWVPVRQETGFVGLYGADGNALVTTTNDRFIIHFLGVSN